MIADLWTVVWKEWREFLAQRSTLLSMAIYLAMFAVLLPSQSGAAWVESPLRVMNLIVLPLFLVLTTVADGFAGERERHTLDTLLASRLSDRAILLGKIAASVAYGWGLTLAALVVALIVANVAAGDGLRLYPAWLGVAAVVFSLLSIVLVATAGMLVSLRASTVRQAQQILNIGLLLIGLVVIGAVSIPPERGRERIGDAHASASAAQLLLAGVLLFLMIDAAVLGVALARFRRPRLAVD
ncbi:MAG: ABC transporter permease [Dehalococcoidia bacterium]